MAKSLLHIPMETFIKEICLMELDKVKVIVNTQMDQVILEDGLMTYGKVLVLYR